jgi:hypothetical protein
MKRSLRACRSLWVAGLLGCAAVAQAQVEAVAADWIDDVRATRWETGTLVAGATVLGARSWNWGSRQSFNWNPEGWFGDSTSSAGMDKLGHAFSSYAINNLLADQLVRQGRPADRAALSALLTTQALMLAVEVLDGFSSDHGFAREDMVMNLLGSGLSYARTVHPTLRDVLDFRLEYQPSGLKGFRPLSDYAGQKYVLALKFSGIEAARQTPLRYLELQAGYYARGHSRAERAAGMDRSRHLFVGIGFNLGEWLFGVRSGQEAEWRHAGRLFLEHIQVPHTALRHDSRH